MRYLILFLLLNNANASIFGSDDRVEIENVDDFQIQELAKSVPALILKSKLKKINSTTFQVNGTSLVEIFNFCPDSKFIKNQKSVANCTAFYLGNNRVGTAGHCFDKKGDHSPENYYLVFDYKTNKTGHGPQTIPAQNVYELKPKWIKREFDTKKMRNDFAIVETKRNIINRTPLEVSKEGRIKEGTPIFILGYPLGLPLKYQPNGQVNMVYDWMNSFEHHLDTSSVNSGSPIFNSHTNEIVAIHVRGTGQHVQERKGADCNDWYQGRPEADWGMGNFIDIINR